ncbi:MAG: ribonucleoside-diphosphate reductase subunit alpha [Candidatus Paceibacterota bacterium]
MSYEWLNEQSQTFLERGYLVGDQTPKGRIREIAETAEEYLQKDGFADKFEDYMSKGYISLASPVWSNFGLDRGLPISCFGSDIADNMSSILYTQAEVGIMSKYGGGTSAHFGNLRERGASISNNGQSNGPVHFMQLFDKMVDVVSQGNVRRGNMATYLPVEHPDIMEFLDIGTEGNEIQGLTHAVTVGDDWMQEMVDGDDEKRAIWAKVIQRRGEIGYPYIMFSDNANNNRPQVYKDKDMRIKATNLCSEIMLPSDEDLSFVCCLSSVNLLHYNEWKDTDLIETVTYFLDAVMEDFIVSLERLRDSDEEEDQQSFEFMKRAHKFAKEHRAVGVGVLGWHSFLQSRSIPMESQEADQLNVEIFKNLKEKTYAASEEMAQVYGEPEVLKGYGRRNTTTMAIAPTTSSSFILGQVSQSIEPLMSNCYVKDLAKIKTTIRNPYLKEILKEKGKDTVETWDSIRDNDGSVQHLDYLSEHEKEVFRTYAEMDQAKIIEQAAVRQQYIDQGQSLNVLVGPEASAKDINELYLKAWRNGVKALYYQHSMNAAQQLSRKKICAACEA